MAFFEILYENSPIPVQNILVSLSGYMKNKKRYGKAYFKYLEFFKKFDKWSLEQKLEYQKRELISFINFAYNNSPFYRELYNDYDISSVKDIKDLKKLPIIDKEMLRENIARVVTISQKDGIESHTGGTTGKSIIVLFTPEDMMKRMAMLDHFKSRVGYKHLHMRRASFSGKHIIPPGNEKNIFWRYNASCKQMIYSSFHLSEKNMEYYIDNLNKFRPQALDGFFTCICDIASYIERHKKRIDFHPIAIFPTSETLTRSGRELVERVFKSKVYDQYASSEGAPFVTECKNQKLHVELATGVFENLNEENDEILVTSFTTHGTPLIRYRIGDKMEFDNHKTICECGIESPLVQEIQGRMLDFLYTAEGAKINGGNVSNLFKNIPNAVIRAQAVQDKIDEIQLILETDKRIYKEEYDMVVKNEFIHKFGKKTKIMIKHVDYIPREKSGKYKMIINNVKNKPMNGEKQY